MLTDVFILSLLAGAATGIGGAAAVIRRPGRRLFNFIMGFSGGVMLSISFTELLSNAIKYSGIGLSIAGFVLGALLIFMLDAAIPHIRFFVRKEGAIGRAIWKVGGRGRKLLKAGALLAIGIFIHNLPEGMAVGAGYSHLPALGLIIAVGIALHNIPEGIATALPLYVGGFSRRNAFLVALLSGFAEPLGAVLAYLFLSAFTPLVPAALAFAAGVMVFITLDELLPVAEKKQHHFTVFGILAGIVSMLLVSSVFGV